MDESANDVREQIDEIDLVIPIEIRTLLAFERGASVSVREGRLLTDAPWVRSLGKLAPAVQHGLRLIAKPWYRRRTIRL